MFQLSAPYPEVEKNMFLPNPELRDSVTLSSTVQIVEVMSGDPYTYVKRRNDKNVYSFIFNLTREKFLDLKKFFKDYAHKKIQIVNYDDNVLIGNILSNPFINSGNKRGAIGPNTETYPVSFQFEVI